MPDAELPDDQVLPPMLAYVFEGEVLSQWEHAALAIDMMNSTLQQSGGQDNFWFGLDAALGALANISKVFWPTRSAPEMTKSRASAMRVAFNVAEGSMMLSRNVRDSFEHFDERLDRWYRDSPRHNIADRSIAGANGIVGLDDGDFARHYDPETHVLRVFGDSVDFQALVAEVEQLVNRVRERHDVIWWRR